MYNTKHLIAVLCLVLHVPVCQGLFDGFIGDLLQRHNNIIDPLACETLCKEHSDCVAYTYMGNLLRNPGACFLRGTGHSPLKGAGKELIVKSGAITGIPNCQNTDSCINNEVVFTKGLMEKLEMIPNLEECKRACLIIEACALFTFFPDKMLCFLRDETATVLHKTKSVKVVSGILNCDRTSNGVNQLGNNFKSQNNLDRNEQFLKDEDAEISMYHSNQDGVGRFMKSKNELEENGKFKKVVLDDVEGCSVNIGKDKASTTELPIPVGSDTVIYCKSEIRKNVHIICEKTRQIKKNELPECNRNFVVNSGHCKVSPPTGVITYPNSTEYTHIPVGSALVALCAGTENTEQPYILPCLAENPITWKDYPVC
ncbi:uncharacterized protein LOC134819542 isoform X2 [Bolinopsis microptera]|uniref:uncharacterized protein LOC134819542 isoform X2 n=1 Tax=Bolinopsis microptera TaxID=2820187 RepID=UPI00307A22C2